MAQKGKPESKMWTSHKGTGLSDFGDNSHVAAIDIKDGPGVAYVDHGARYDPIVPGELDRGGAINTITPHKGTSRNCRGGMVVSGFLVEVEPVNLDELQRQYPEAFNRPYHHASGLDFNRILVGGEQE